MKMILKRILSYMIDVILVSLVATFLTSNTYINKDYNKYLKTYDEYEILYENHIDFLKDLEDFYEDKKITQEEFEKLNEEYEDYSEYLKNIKVDKKISKEKYDKIIKKVNKDYENQEVNYSYKIVKLSLIQTIISMLCILMYFVVFQYYFNGQTLGKKIMRLQVQSNDNKELGILNYFIRSLVVNEVAFTFINIVCLLVLNQKYYIFYSQVMYWFTYTIEMLIIFTIIFNKNNRGIHDLISNTKVVEIKEKGNSSEM